MRWHSGAGRRWLAAVLVASILFVGGSAAPAGAGLLSPVTGLLSPVTGTVNGLLGIVTAGWDDGATTPPVSMRTVADAIGADDLWARGVDGTGVGVALLDSGVVPVDGLAGPGKVVNGPDLSFESQADAYRHLDTFGHGTHMAGIIAGRDSAGGFKGVAPGAHLVSLKLATREGATDVSQVIAAIDWVVQHRNDPGMNIRVLNLAFGTDSLQDYRVDPLAHAVESAARNGIVVVVSGGNDGSAWPALTNPATNPRVIAVGAVDLKGTASALDDTVAPFSSRGSSARSVDLVAPGVSLTSLRDPGSQIDTDHPGAVVQERFFRGSGTSQAAAVVAGAAALLLDARPDLNPDQVKRLLTSSATPLLGAGVRAQGAGRLNVNAASLLPALLSQQPWAASTGTGSLEAARGSSHVAEDGVELVGERDIMGSAWNGARWAPSSTAGAAWSGGTWNGVDWAGSCWCGASWSGVTTWEGRSWTGRSWTGPSWTADEWLGRSWTGRSWTGRSWTGRSWTGRSWTGRSWTTPS